LLWQRDELAMFLHFGVNTFTDREWGDGRESPTIFNPGALDAREWARTARRAGFKAMILTAKHHDGFCLWPTTTTRHSVASSPWRGGQGDLVREFTEACRLEGLRAGLYLSPWDQNSPVYGDSPRYDEFYSTQLTELLTRYGPIHEVLTKSQQQTRTQLMIDLQVPREAVGILETSGRCVEEQSWTINRGQAIVRERSHHQALILFERTYVQRNLVVEDTVTASHQGSI
jgi:alpha-L-fucosidase